MKDKNKTDTTETHFRKWLETLEGRMCNKRESLTAGEASLQTRLRFAFTAGAEAQKEIEQQEESRPPSVVDGHWQAIAASITACQKMSEMNDGYSMGDLKEAWEDRIVELLKIVTTK